MLYDGIPMGRVEEKVAFVTGAARGQGRCHAVRLAEEGADIVALDLCEEVADVWYSMPTSADLEETARQVEATGRRIVARQGDVRSLSSVQEVVAAGVKELGRLDIVVANAGIATFGGIEELTESTWQDTIDTNLTGVWNTAKAALPELNDGGSIVITSSTAGLRGFPSLGHYVAAKHGAVGLMKALAQELGARRIRVNTVNPTQVNTEMIAGNGGVHRLFCADIENPTLADFAVASEQTMLLPVPWVEPIDVAEAVLFLASDAARYITGVALPIDAGALTK
jgi:(+)-trans-carveol dehydrogenase